MKNGQLLNKAASLLVGAIMTMGLTSASAEPKKAAVNSPDASIYKVSAEKSDVTWLGKKVTGSHTGKINIKSGELKVANNALTGGTFVIDMTSITDTDLKDPEYNGKLIGHLKSDDFFSVEKNPTATFTITKLTPIASAKTGEANTTVDGDLTIKGTTKPLSFPATIIVGSDAVNASAKAIKVDRTAYDIRYGSKKFFQSIGDKAIYDDFFLDVTLVASKS